VWGGRIVSESTLTSRISAARRTIGDDGETQTYLRTIPRRGFRFVGAVQERSSAETASNQDASQMKNDGERLQPAPGAILTAAEKPSVAVLPFTNLSSDPNTEYFADGIAEDQSQDFQSDGCALSLAVRVSLIEVLP
jgi:hypothetical protein